MRITPAYAGKSLPCPALLRFRQDHPRVCGEKHTHLNGTFLNLGSPPRMRGKAPLLSKAPSECGITPAYAGKSDYRCVTAQAYWDHPRVCGEKYFAIRDKVAKKGSPPRMRGKVVVPVKSSACCRITPAYAGKSCPAVYGNRLAQDHPRVCGEKVAIARLLPCLLGSPPRMRGKVR